MSFTKAAAFLRRQAPWVMLLEPTLTRNPPSNHTLTTLRFSPIGVSELHRLEPEEPILLLPLLLGVAFPYALAHFPTRLDHTLMNRR
jgi:hypothetical protein